MIALPPRTLERITGPSPAQVASSAFASRPEAGQAHEHAGDVAAVGRGAQDDVGHALVEEADDLGGDVRRGDLAGQSPGW